MIMEVISIEIFKALIFNLLIQRTIKCSNNRGSKENFQVNAEKSTFYTNSHSKLLIVC